MIPLAPPGPSSQLLIKHLLDRPLTWAPERKIIYRDILELTYREFAERVRRLAHLLVQLGVKPGDCVGVLDADSHRYLELFFAVPMIGAVLHTINMRLLPEQIHYTIEHAEDRVLFINSDFAALAGALLPRLPLVTKRVLLSDSGPIPQVGFAAEGEYESLLRESPADAEFPDFSEDTVATLFYTTGTTGSPKGVFFTHRQLVLHTLSVALILSASTQPLDISVDDVYMPLTPLFHAHAWGVPYIATLLGLKQVYPGRYEPERLLHWMAQHRVTFSHCVPTILQTLLHHPASRGVDLSNWKVMIGGSALPEGLAKEAGERGIRLMAGYGMSETCPVAAVGHLQPRMAGWDAADQRDVFIRAGLPVPLVRARVVDPKGTPLPPGKTNTGELVLQAPWLTAGYFKDPEKSRELWRDGWLHTGDVACIDDDGYVRITDRLKDVIKIGGEWISSLELENALSQHEAVKETAVVAQPDPHWGERPYAQVVLREDKRADITAKTLAHFLHRFVEEGRIHKRAILTQIQIVESLPRTSVGKLDKKAIRARIVAV
jgi:fatty-acyl-CoA synthase